MTTLAMYRLLRAVFVALIAAALAMPAFAQAPPNLALARVRYNSLKNTAKPEGELKAQIDAIDREMADAIRLGRTGEVRRLLSKGTALLNGREWTALDDFDASLVLRTDRAFLDPATPVHVRLEQIYAPAIELTSPLTVRVSLRPLLAQPSGSLDVHELARFENVSRDLRESPLAMSLKLAEMPDGPHVLDVAVLDGERPMGTVNLRVWVQQRLDARLAALETSTKSLPEDVRADVRYPADYLRKVNGGLVEMGTFDLTKELDTAEAVVTAAKGGAHPFAARTGDFERHYLLDAADEIMPYRVYVPKAYDGSKPYPLVVALHGLGANEDSFFDAYQRRMPALAEQHGYLVAAPLGYRVDGFYGSSIAASNDTGTRRTRELSEQDVMEVLRRMRREYNVDERRIYLMGHSMGAIGTWYLAGKYADLWAAVAPFSGAGDPASVARMRGIPQFVVHGDADPTVPVAGSRVMVAAMKKLGMDVTYIEVPGGHHNDVVAPNLPGAFDFFGKKRKNDAPGWPR